MQRIKGGSWLSVVYILMMPGTVVTTPRTLSEQVILTPGERQLFKHLRRIYYFLVVTYHSAKSAILVILKSSNMPNYLIEISHSGDAFQCRQVIKLFVTSGSHLLANAHWGCKDGVHKAWFISDFENKEQALQVVPAYLKRDTNIIELVKFDKDDIAKFAHDKTD